jgi:hypothetical protein
MLVIFSCLVIVCNTWYYPNYYIHKEHSVPSYYPGVPQVIQATMHCYVETVLAESFATVMVCA